MSKNKFAWRHFFAGWLFWIGAFVILAIVVAFLTSCGPMPETYIQPATPTAVTVQQPPQGVVEYGWQDVDGPSGCRSAVQYYISDGRRVYTGGTMVFCGDAPSIAFP